MPKSYPPEFRRRALDRIDAGHTVVAVAHDLEVSPQTLYTWRRQHLVDIGELDGDSTIQSAQLRAANREIKRLRTELAVTTRANELLKESSSPKGGSRRLR